MAITGLSEPFIGEYNSGDFAGGRSIGHAIEYSLDIETQEANPLYGDGLIIEVEKIAVFQSGILTLDTSEIPQEILEWLFNLDTETVGEYTQYLYNDNTEPRTIGFGIVETHVVDGVQKYKAVILPRCRPRIPNGTATTEGEAIEWQSEQIEFVVERSEVAGKPWKYESWHDAEQDARQYLRYQLGFFGFSPLVDVGQVDYMIIE